MSNLGENSTRILKVAHPKELEKRSTLLEQQSEAIASLSNVYAIRFLYGAKALKEKKLGALIVPLFITNARSELSLFISWQTIFDGIACKHSEEILCVNFSKFYFIKPRFSSSWGEASTSIATKKISL